MLQAIHDEERVDDVILHDHLREAVVNTMDPHSPWNEATTRGAVAMMVYDATGMPYSKAEAKAYGKGPRAVAPDARQARQANPVAKARVPPRPGVNLQLEDRLRHRGHGEPRSRRGSFQSAPRQSFCSGKIWLDIKDMAQCRCYVEALEVPMARCAHTGLLLICLSQFCRRSKVLRVVESLRVPSPGTRTAYMLTPSRWQVNGYTWDPSGPLSNPDQK